MAFLKSLRNMVIPGRWPSPTAWIWAWHFAAVEVSNWWIRMRSSNWNAYYRTLPHRAIYTVVTTTSVTMPLTRTKNNWLQRANSVWQPFVRFIPIGSKSLSTTTSIRNITSVLKEGTGQQPIMFQGTTPTRVDESRGTTNDVSMSGWDLTSSWGR